MRSVFPLNTRDKMNVDLLSPLRESLLMPAPRAAADVASSHRPRLANQRSTRYCSAGVNNAGCVCRMSDDRGDKAAPVCRAATGARRALTANGFTSIGARPLGTVALMGADIPTGEDPIEASQDGRARPVKMHRSGRLCSLRLRFVKLN